MIININIKIKKIKKYIINVHYRMFPRSRAKRSWLGLSDKVIKKVGIVSAVFAKLYGRFAALLQV